MCFRSAHDAIWMVSSDLQGSHRLLTRSPWPSISGDGLATFWQCAKCVNISRSEGVPSCVGCSEQSQLGAAKLRQTGYDCVVLRRSEDTELTVFVRCKCYSSVKAKGLRPPCGKETPTTIQNWKRIRRGNHPKSRKKVFIETKSRIRL